MGAGAPHVVGVDIFKGQWLAASITLDLPRKPRFELFTSLGRLAERYAEAEAIAVDIPIGLAEQGFREADRAAAVFIGGRRSSVFSMPSRAAMAADTHALAIQVSRDLGHAAPSAQAYALRARVLEAEMVASADPRVFEVHPEVSFRAMAGEPLPWGKKTWNGTMARRSLLARHGIGIQHDLGDAGRAAADDVLDACAAAWTARRIARGEADSLPDPPQLIAGREIAIWY